MTPFTPSFDADSDAVWDVEDEHPMDMAALASRIQTVREADAVQERLEGRMGQLAGELAEMRKEVQGDEKEQQGLGHRAVS